ncbi:MAG: hypothetical protein WC511_02250 [Candidatus Pacearchaeota archaeon]
MAVVIKLESPDFEVLKETKSLVVYNIAEDEKTGDFETPKDLIKSSLPSLTSEIKKEAQKEGLVPDSYDMVFYLALGKESKDVDELGFIEHENAILTASSDLGKVEVNGFMEYKLFLLGIIE